jgi:hypothetical protein
MIAMWAMIFPGAGLANSGCRLYDPAPSLWSWGSSSVGRAPRSQCGGRGFDPLLLHQFKIQVCPESSISPRQCGLFCGRHVRCGPSTSLMIIFARKGRFLNSITYANSRRTSPAGRYGAQGRAARHDATKTRAMGRPRRASAGSQRARHHACARCIRWSPAMTETRFMVISHWDNGSGGCIDAIGDRSGRNENRNKNAKL